MSAGQQTSIIGLANTALDSGTSVSYTVFDPRPLPTDGTPANQRMLGNVHVPEPSAVALLGLDMFGSVGLVVLLRRRSRRQA